MAVAQDSAAGDAGGGPVEELAGGGDTGGQGEGEPGERPVTGGSVCGGVVGRLVVFVGRWVIGFWVLARCVVGRWVIGQSFVARCVVGRCSPQLRKECDQAKRCDGGRGEERWPGGQVWWAGGAIP